MINIVLISSIPFFLSLTLTYIIKRIALKHQIVDVPNERSSHDAPTPTGGGLAILISWFLGITFLFFFNWIEKNLYFALLCGILLAVVSLIDDIISVPPVIRLAIQFITAILSFYFINGVSSLKILGFEISSVFVLYPVTIVGIVWFINLFNFLDGIDGFASLEAVTIAAVMLIFSSNFINLVLIGSVAGFLYWNWPKAKIFMGDIGSTQLGFILVILGIYFHNQTQFDIIHWIMLTSLFWFDATLTLFRRWKNKEKLSVAHRKHVYQRAVQSGLSHKSTILISFAINLGIIGLVVVSERFDYLIIPSFVINIIILYGITRMVDKKVPFINNGR